MKRLFTIQTAWPWLTLLGVYAAVCAFLGDFRYSDPDQYFHFSIAREWAQTWNIWRFPQVTGMGWDHYFNDKEFLFHVLATLAYSVAGDLGVITISYTLGFAAIAFIYKIVFRLTERSSLALFATLALFLSETFVMQLMLVRAYVASLLLVLIIIYCLLEKKKKFLLVACFFYSWSYHALYIPSFIILIFCAIEYSYNRNLRLPLQGLCALILGTLIHPYFPDNYRMTWLGLQIVADQLHMSELAYGLEQQPFRSDNMIVVFRFAFLFLLLGATVLWLSFVNSNKLKKPILENLRGFQFFSILAVSFFLFLFVSPRVQIYFIPFVTIFGALALDYFIQQKISLLSMSLLCIVMTGITWPYKTFTESMFHFKEFDRSYIEIVKKVPASKNVFNCEWWGGHYSIYANPNVKVLDVLDPALLRTRDEQLFTTVTQLRLGKTLDPYFMIGSILKYEYVLCSSKTPLHQQLERDPRFERLTQSNNYLGDLSLFRLTPNADTYELQALETKKDNTDWKTRPRYIDNIPIPAYIAENTSHTCSWIRPQEAALKIIETKNYFAFTGTGILTVYKNDELYLDATTMTDEFVWGELLLPIQSGQNKWTFKICPHQQGARLSLAIFVLDKKQKDVWCHSDKTTQLSSKYTVKQQTCNSRFAELNDVK